MESSLVEKYWSNGMQRRRLFLKEYLRRIKNNDGNIAVQGFVTGTFVIEMANLHIRDIGNGIKNSSY